jgi:hypothetical protein
MRKYHNVSLQGLELLVTVLLARNRQPHPTVAAGAPHAELAAGLVTLPSGPPGLLAMVCEAIVTLKVRLGAAGTHACSGARTVCGVLEALLVVSVLDALQVSDVVRAGPDSQRTGPLRRSSRLSTLRARATA